MAGTSGVGKSTLAQQIATQTGAVTIDLDVIKSAALEAGTTYWTAPVVLISSLTVEQRWLHSTKSPTLLLNVCCQMRASSDVGC